MTTGFTSPILRDTQPERLQEFEGGIDSVERILTACRQYTVKIGDRRLDLPQKPPYIMEHNLWIANAPGSTLFIPVADQSEEFLALLAMFVGSGYTLIDDYAKRPAGNLASFIRSGLLAALDLDKTSDFYERVLGSSHGSSRPKSLRLESRMDVSLDAENASRECSRLEP